mgnify:CR=1 FL=1
MPVPFFLPLILVITRHSSPPANNLYEAVTVGDEGIAPLLEPCTVCVLPAEPIAFAAAPAIVGDSQMSAS